jgi:hypothetical protein
MHLGKKTFDWKRQQFLLGDDSWEVFYTTIEQLNMNFFYIQKELCNSRERTQKMKRLFSLTCTPSLIISLYKYSFPSSKV